MGGSIPRWSLSSGREESKPLCWWSTPTPRSTSRDVDPPIPQDHLTGPLPEPVTNGDMEDKANGKVAEKAEPKVSVSPSPSNASSNASLSTPPTSTPPPEVCESVPGEIPALSMSLKQVKELAHQKRMQKKAPQMDWSKKNELFSNL
ncbi:hypothetical protein AALO_G00283090 [Alosa alosa]|uniref:EBP50 C-terminal domain-containing protein n=1 Tax=Alosa alosa TaxID=278164 RepID=A0AAV6FK01_9TELE|nr:hypothetical protein AALO_G00283090 [Alosa alosa]